MVGAFLIQDSDIEVSMRQASFGDIITFAGKKIDFKKKLENKVSRDEIDETHSEMGFQSLIFIQGLISEGFYHAIKASDF